MDKDKFRELLQSFEQLAVKPEAGGGAEFDSDIPVSLTLEPKYRRVSGAINAEPQYPDIYSLMAEVSDAGVSFPELEATHPPPNNDAFQPSEALKSIGSGGNTIAEMRTQQQLHTASRFRFIAGLMAQLWLQSESMARDRTASLCLRNKMAKMKSDLVDICSASLIEAGQIESQAQEPTVELPFTPGGLTPTKPSISGRTSSMELVVYPKSNSLMRCGEQEDMGPVQDIALGARIVSFASMWLAVTADPWVLRTVTEGLRFDFSAPPECTVVPDPEYTQDESAAIEKVIRWDLGDKVIKEISYRPDLFVSHMYTLPIAGRLKALVEFRMLNKYLDAGSIVINETPSLRSMLHRGDWITRISIKCAYPSVPIHSEHQRYLVFKYDGRYYQYCALPFGISVASKSFTKLLQAALQPLRDEGLRIISHIDEMCLLHSSYSELTEQTRRLCRHLVDLGFLINTGTSDLVPQQNQRFLGFVFNTIDGEIQFPKDQIKKVRRAAHNARSSAVTAKQLAALLGKIRSIMPAVGPELWRIGELELCLDNAIVAPDSWDNPVNLSPSALAEINWLCDNILTKKSMPFDTLS